MKSGLRTVVTSGHFSGNFRRKGSQINSFAILQGELFEQKITSLLITQALKERKKQSELLR